MQNGIVRMFLSWLGRPQDIDKEIINVEEDIQFLSKKIVLARRMYCDVIAAKMTMTRDKMIKKRSRLIVKRREMFNK